MITKTMKIEDTLIFIPELEKYQGKIVEIKVKEKKKKKKNLKNFFSLRGKIFIDKNEIEKLREESII